MNSEYRPALQAGLMLGMRLSAGAETGAGGRIRDTHATGTGSIMGASTAGYCVGNLLLDNYDAPWEDASEPYPESLAPPLQVSCESSMHGLPFPTLNGMNIGRFQCMAAPAHIQHGSRKAYRRELRLPILNEQIKLQSRLAYFQIPADPD